MKKFIFAITLMIPLFSLKAQENGQTGLLNGQTDQEKKAAIKTTFVANKLHDNWFISLSGGIADLMSEESRYVDFSERIKPTIGFSVGKWMSPVWGLRLNVTAAELQGFASWDYENDLGRSDWYMGSNHPYTGQANADSYLNVYDDKDKAAFVRERFLDADSKRTVTYGGETYNGYDYNLKYAGGSVDFLWNINNTFRPYNEKRLFELIFMAGVAYAHTFKESSGVDDYYRTAVNTIGVKGGAQAKFRLSRAVDLNLEAHLYVLPEMFDRRVGDGNTMDGVANYMIGFTYNFKKRNFDEPYTPTVIDERVIIPPTPIIVEDNSDELRARIKELEDMLAKKRPIEKERMKVVVHFLIDKHNVRPSEMYKLDEIADFMNKYPKVKVSVSGYADKKTAYPEYNMKLGERRANEVIRILTTKYGLDKSRFVIKSFGDTVQPFDINELNRAVIAFDIEE